MLDKRNEKEIGRTKNLSSTLAKGESPKRDSSSQLIIGISLALMFRDPMLPRGNGCDI